MKTNVLMLLILTCLVFDSCTKEEATVTFELSIKNGDVIAFFDEEITYKAELLNSTGFAENIQQITWQSSNEQIARVDTKGKVECIGVGACVIRAFVEHDNQIDTAEVALEVLSPSLFVLSPNAIDAYRSNTNLKIETANKATSPIVFGFESSNTNVVSIEPTGAITVHNTGTCEIKVTALNVEGKPFKVVPVQINPNLDPAIITSVVIDERSYRVCHPTKQVSYSAKAYNSYGQEIPATFTWTVGDPNLGSVDGTGLVTAGQQLGNTYVYASTQGVQSEGAFFGVGVPCGYNGGPPIPMPTLHAPFEVHLQRGETRKITGNFDGKLWYPEDVSPCGANMPNIVSINDDMVTGLNPGVTVLSFGRSGASDFTIVYVH